MKKKTWIAVGCVVLAAVIGLGAYFFAFHLPRQRKLEERRQFMRAYYEAKIAAYKEENKQYAPFEVDVAFLGDSLTDGYDLTRYYPQYVTANRGIGGDTTFGLYDRLQVSAYDLQPKVVVMLIGANNFGTMFENYEDIVKGLRENLPETKVVLLSLTSMSGEWGKNNEKAAYNNARIKLVAQKYSCAFVDLYTPLMNLTTGEIFPEYTTDGGHLTAAGYQVFTDTLTPVLEELLGK